MWQYIVTGVAVAASVLYASLRIWRAVGRREGRGGGGDHDSCRDGGKCGSCQGCPYDYGGRSH